MRLANALFALCFLASLALQHNDPDPLPWMLLYGAAAGACLAWERRRAHRLALAGLAAVALAWAAGIAWTLRLETSLGAALTDWQMHAGGSEEAREIGGLALVAFWLIILAARPQPMEPQQR